VFGDLAMIQLAALEAEVARLKADLAGKDESFNRLAREAENHRIAYRFAAKRADSEKARAANLESALEAATARCKSLEESARRLLAERDDLDEKRNDYDPSRLHP